jgi:hypothetical protein
MHARHSFNFANHAVTPETGGLACSKAEEDRWTIEALTVVVAA